MESAFYLFNISSESTLAKIISIQCSDKCVARLIKCRILGNKFWKCARPVTLI